MLPIYSHRFPTLSAWLAVTFVMAGNCAHAAPIIAFTQNRSVAAIASASVGGSPDSDSALAAAPDFGAFNGSIAPSAVALSAASGQSASATGSASQVSSLGTSSVSADSTAQALLGLTAGENGSAAANPSSVFEFVFDIAEASSYALTGSVNTQAIVTGGAGIPSLLNDLLFENVTTSTTLFQTLTNDESFSISGLLDPGRYRLSASATVDASQASVSANARTVTGISSYAFTLDVTSTSVPEPASLALVLTALALIGIGRTRIGIRATSMLRAPVTRTRKPTPRVQ